MLRSMRIGDVSTLFPTNSNESLHCRGLARLALVLFGPFPEKKIEKHFDVRRSSALYGLVPIWY